MRHKYTLQDGIRNHAEWVLSHYHEDKRQMEQYRQETMPSGTANYGATGGGSSGPGDPTGRAAEKLLTSQYLITTERNIKAVERALKRCDETDMRLIELIYWDKKYNATGAGEVAGLKQNGTYKRINKILVAVALEMGLIYI